jgi:S-adenosylmethionine:tRNA-ribosyltransferase-isomerase (queuine synthetase)
VTVFETLATPRTRFDRPAGSDATEPPEAHGVARDAVKLLVARPGALSHARFADLGDHLRPGDLLVVNDSATLPPRSTAAAAGTGSRSTSPPRFATHGPPRTGWSSCGRQGTQAGT